MHKFGPLPSENARQHLRGRRPLPAPQSPLHLRPEDRAPRTVGPAGTQHQDPGRGAVRPRVVWGRRGAKSSLLKHGEGHPLVEGDIGSTFPDTSFEEHRDSETGPNLRQSVGDKAWREERKRRQLSLGIGAL